MPGALPTASLRITDTSLPSSMRCVLPESPSYRRGNWDTEKSIGHIRGTENGISYIKATQEVVKVRVVPRRSSSRACNFNLYHCELRNKYYLTAHCCLRLNIYPLGYIRGLHQPAPAASKPASAHTNFPPRAPCYLLEKKKTQLSARWREQRGQ